MFITPESKSLLQLGHLDSIAIKEKWLGINGKTSWRQNGLQLAFFISIATGIFMFLAVKYTNSLYNFKWSFVPIILLVSLTNSFSEEIIYRFAINGNLMHLTSKLTILICSAVLFGLPHYQGYPNGFMGVLMAGLLGYILSKATYETQGLGLAWIIHFLQDIIIFTSLFMINIKT
ncbi:MAG: CPBP family intramembrane metalloprotease [Bacteroidia bacterium]|nr:CPBP family intramembrane metalloprotease [Bacteroidia bacterium]